jgi:uncharacterized protein YbgA (DUF1722 family)
MSGSEPSPLRLSESAYLARLGSLEVARLSRVPEHISELSAFHAGSKLLLLVHSEVGMRSLGRVVANAAGRSPVEVARLYREGFGRALSVPPTSGRVVNALQHAAGHFSRVLGPAEKRRFADVLDGYAAGARPLEEPLAVLRGWLARHPVPWLEVQSLLRAQPARQSARPASADRIGGSSPVWVA